MYDMPYISYLPYILFCMYKKKKNILEDMYNIALLIFL